MIFRITTPRSAPTAYSSPLITGRSPWEQSVCNSLIGARHNAGLSIGARLYLILVNNKLRTCVVLSPCTSPTMRPRLASAGLLVLARWRWRCICTAPSYSCSLFGTATYHHRASMMTEWAKGLSKDQGKPFKEVSKVAMFRTQCASERGERRRTKKTCTTFPDVTP